MKRELRLIFSAEEDPAEKDGRREAAQIFRRFLEGNAEQSEAKQASDEKKTG